MEGSSSRTDGCSSNPVHWGYLCRTLRPSAVLVVLRCAVDAAQKVKPPGAPVLHTADISQADLSPRLEEEE